MTEEINISDLTPDQSNANLGTERGRYMLEASLEQNGLGRSILIDKNGHIIAGNKTAEVAGELGLEDVLVVRTKGDKLVAVMREDIDLDTEEGRRLAYADNRAGEVNLEFDPDQIARDLGEGMDLSDMWQEWELEDLLAGIEIDLDFAEGDDGFSEGTQFSDTIRVSFTMPRDTLGDIKGALDEILEGIGISYTVQSA